LDRARRPADLDPGEDSLLILVTNDDGIHAPGIAALAEGLKALGQVVVVAPDRQRSAIGRALTLHKPLRAEELLPGRFAVDGTPADCVNLALHGLLAKRPQLIVSGINHGANLGDDITYSGTVSAAMEGTLLGIPAMAVSLAANPGHIDGFAHAAAGACRIATMILRKGLPPDTLLNVNVPPGTPLGMRLTRQGRRIFGELAVEKTDPRGRKYYWLGAAEPGYEDMDGTDFRAVNSGYISVTPLHLDLTNYRSFAGLQAWKDETAADFFAAVQP